ncbi:amino acid permease [bacterium DOLZORAL124_38_8]|nr:MAG: amino acid permease [bacterium DOLZORAL124_38_8]
MKLTEKYGLLTAISLVFGGCVGSGIFFKSDDILRLTNGNISQAILAWCLGALAMVFGALVFGEFAQRINDSSNGIVDYFEVAYGKLPAYLVGWFKWISYLLPLTAIVAWVSANYTTSLLAETLNLKANVWMIASAYLAGSYALNYFAPKISGKFQVSTVAIKCIPIFFIGVIGFTLGLKNGITLETFTAVLPNNEAGGLFAAVVSTAFAYEGWIVAVSVTKEVKNSKINMPKALLYGTLAVFAVYLLYFLGLTQLIEPATILEQGDNAPYQAVKTLLGNFGGALFTSLIIVSCLGTMNGLAMASIRDPHSIAVRGQGPIPKKMSQIDRKTNIPVYGTIISALLAFVYLALWFCSLTKVFGTFVDISEIPIVAIYTIYIFLYGWYMIHFKDLSFFKRFIIPTLATIGAGIILYGGMSNPNIGLYLFVSFGITLFGLVFYRTNPAPLTE